MVEKRTRERPANKAKKKMKSYVSLSLLTQMKIRKFLSILPPKNKSEIIIPNIAPQKRKYRDSLEIALDCGHFQ